MQLYNEIEKVYEEFFHPKIRYVGGFKYANAKNYGFVDFKKWEYPRVHEFSADEYVAFTGTHCDHLTIPEPYRSNFFNGLRQVIMDAGNKLVSYETDILYTIRKPL